jgi:hypothetical protein
MAVTVPHWQCCQTLHGATVTRNHGGKTTSGTAATVTDSESGPAGLYHWPPAPASHRDPQCVCGRAQLTLRAAVCGKPS